MGQGGTEFPSAWSRDHKAALGDPDANEGPGCSAGLSQEHSPLVPLPSAACPGAAHTHPVPADVHSTHAMDLTHAWGAVVQPPQHGTTQHSTAQHSIDTAQ